MTEPTASPAAPYQVVISDEVMERIKVLPPGAIDSIARAIGELQHDPDHASSIPFTPIPVDHSEGRPTTWVPATRAPGYLRDAVAEISPKTVAHFDAELQEMTRFTGENGRDGQIRGLRMFVMRWVEYIALQGDHVRARHIKAAADPEEFAERFSEAMRATHRAYFPDAGRQPGTELAIQTQKIPGRNGYLAVCPVTQLRAEGDTEEKAQAKLRGLLLEWITG